MKAVLIVVITCGVLAVAAGSNHDIFDSAGKVLVSGQTSELSRELPHPYEGDNLGLRQ